MNKTSQINQKNKTNQFEHPAWYSPVVPDVQIRDVRTHIQSFPRPAGRNAKDMNLC